MLHVDQMYLTANGVLVRFKNRCVCALNTENAEKTSYCASERYFPLRSIGSKCGWFRLVGSSVVLLSQTAQHKIKRNKRKRCIEHFQNWNTCGLFFVFSSNFYRSIFISNTPCIPVSYHLIVVKGKKIRFSFFFSYFLDRFSIREKNAMRALFTSLVYHTSTW